MVDAVVATLLTVSLAAGERRDTRYRHSSSRTGYSEKPPPGADRVDFPCKGIEFRRVHSLLLLLSAISTDSNEKHLNGRILIRLRINHTVTLPSGKAVRKQKGTSNSLLCDTGHENKNR